jgi:Cu-Zn family superoxide dismutase
MRIHFPQLGVVLAIVMLAGCSTPSGHKGQMDQMGPTATADLKPTAGNTTAGTARFAQHGDHVMVVARVTGLKPGQEHGFHVHEKGDCSSPDGMSTGGHFNPTGKPHGPQNAEHHVGDLPALKADANGNAEARFHLMGMSVGSGPTDIVGKGLIVHAAPDDYKTQPTGNAGARLACAVISKS